ncbi:MAG: succinate dehydrogenase, cytochrome b556 subunit [Thiobacillus sp.]
MLPDTRPVYLNLFRLHLPITGWVSILHRLSGALLFFLLPLMVWGFTLTLSGEAGYARAVAWLSTLAAKLLTLALVWVFAHHFFAGLRHLAMDSHWGVSLKSARLSGLVVLLTTGGVVVLTAWGLFR